MYIYIKSRFKEWNKRSCPKCGCKPTKDVDHVMYTESIVGEYTIACANCGQHMNYWAQGSTREPETRTGYMKCWLSHHNLVFKIKRWRFRVKLERFKRKQEKLREKENLDKLRKEINSIDIVVLDKDSTIDFHLKDHDKE
ncbi:hypothetical protein CampHawk_171 [Bacillus phage CampHawk]|uniref:Uncharacterized protein n=1 Tax=Bacillus phage CampHawk TaxID=1406783 RepID=U5PT63_9CAUD|nr:hypothetical protein CampHawk_171 [Bacillus phage CampHawk]AGY47049.1 hypothetical protein CampHawk_171 [Bacillus phage CampHawk]